MSPQPKHLLIVSEPRTGSNNLTYSLSAHPDVELGNELLHPVNGWRRSQAGLPNQAPADDPVFDFASASTDDRRVFLEAVFAKLDGFKVHTEHSTSGDILAIARDMDCVIVRCTRRSLFDQAISNYVAIARSVWHADEAAAKEKLSEHSPTEVDATRFMQWIEATWRRRLELSRALMESDLTYCSVEYETFFATAATGVTMLNEIFALAGRPRLGELTSQDERELAYASALRYLDSSGQKMTPQEDWASLVSNLSELENRYVKWWMSAPVV